LWLSFALEPAPKRIRITEENFSQDTWTENPFVPLEAAKRPFVASSSASPRSSEAISALMGLCFGRNSEKLSKRDAKNHPNRSPEELHLLSGKSRNPAEGDVSPRDTIMGETQSTQKKDPQGQHSSQSKNQQSGKPSSAGSGAVAKGMPGAKPISNSAGDNHVVRLHDSSDSDDSPSGSPVQSTFNPPLKQASMSIPHFDSADLEPKAASAREAPTRDPWGVGSGVGSSQEHHFGNTRSLEQSYYGDTTSSESSGAKKFCSFYRCRFLTTQSSCFRFSKYIRAINHSHKAQ
jgi:hypothetical protein